MLQGLAGCISHTPPVTFSTRNSSSSCPAASLSSWIYRVACFDHLLRPSYPRTPASPQTQSPEPPLPAQPYFIFK